MLVRGVADIQVVQEQAALLRIAMLVARGEPLDSLFGAVSAEVSQLLHVDAGAVMRLIGAERAVTSHGGELRVACSPANLLSTPGDPCTSRA